MCDKKGIYSFVTPMVENWIWEKMVKMCVWVCVDVLLIQSHIICALDMLYVKSCMEVKICICEDN